MTTVLSASIRNFEGAHDIVINDQTIVDHSSHVYNVKKTRERPGLSKLLEYSMREAFHDSSGRWPPPRCHYDSRQELRTTITNWGTGKSDTIREILLWMHGPFGVGKSAVAQSCAEALAAENKLRASLFFSRPNGRNNPNRVFTSIAYQLALKCPLLGDILDHEILKNPTLLTAAHPLQFQELLVAPLRQVKPQGIDIEGWVVILDGLDEVDDTNAQCDLLNIIAASIRDHTTPLRWFILSRLEPHIQRAMRAHGVLPLSHSLELPLSLEDDHEILTFFVKELHKIGEQHDLPPSWCSEADIAALVKLAQGLWIYVSTVTRFIGDPNSLGPPTQLRLVLSLAQKQSKPLATNPLATMDLFYNLIMQQIPPHVSLIIRKILLLREVCPDATNEVDQSRGTVRVVGLSKLANVLGLSEKELHNACIFLQSVLFLQQSVVGDPMDIRFYHASFMEYMEDSTRSKDFCIYGDDCLDYLRQEIIERINEAHSHSTGKVAIIDATLPGPQSHSIHNYRVYYSLVDSLMALCSCTSKGASLSISPSTAAALQRVQFSKIPRLLGGSTYRYLIFDHKSLRNNLPPEYRDKIVSRSRNPVYFLTKKPRYTTWERPFILGSGANKLICWYYKRDKGHVKISF